VTNTLRSMKNPLIWTLPAHIVSAISGSVQRG
jgi:hypothetical protein